MKKLSISLLMIIIISIHPLFAQIDYSLNFSTYLGGSAFEQARDICSDKDGNIYVTGGTQSEDFPTTPGAYEREFHKGGSALGNGGPMMVFISKFSPTGEMIWSTMLGGPNYDRAYAIEVDDLGYVYVGGRAGDEFPTTSGVVQEDFGGDQATTKNGLYGKQDGFMAKLSPDGSELIWCTYIGSDDAGFFRDITIDDKGAVYGILTNVRFPLEHVPDDAYLNELQEGKNCIPIKISPDGKEVEWASYFGGSGDDGGGPAIRVDSEYNSYIYGSSNSTDLPVTDDAYDKTYNGGNSDVFIAKFSSDGKELIFCTYFGGSGNDALETHGIYLDKYKQPNVIVPTNSKDIPVSDNAYQKTNYATNWSYAVAKFSSDGSELLACTYVGGSTGQSAESIFVDDEGKIYVGGGTVSEDYPVTKNAWQSDIAGGRDAFASVISSDCSELLYSTFLGGSSDDAARCSWADNKGNIYIAGQTKSNDFPVKNAFQDSRKDKTGREDNLVAVFNPLISGISDQIKSTEISIFPNPTSGMINIEIKNSQLENYELCNLLGLEIMSGKINSEKSSIDLSRLPAGVYLLRVDNKSYKIIKN